ncbi:M1 family metallopeptidase [Saccharothrix australiensis]|uniref:Aminopeptidase N n=1 Tax=Saccharothrix australiensis TaxID=2072 RepID=A0A495W277_9PSEU|nr:M1 family metallopeptidase [Saccharothrix australiensis]RKT54813.1 peptidase M1-like protein [Saccharothrix australiensis]
MRKTLIGLVVAALALGATPAHAAEPGAPGLGDPYYPRAGNAGYDVRHYSLGLQYDPATDVLTGRTVVNAVTTRDVSSVNFDFALPLLTARVNGRDVGFAQHGTELTVGTGGDVPAGTDLSFVFTYSASPSRTHAEVPVTRWKRTPDGALAVAAPSMSPWWYPANDHPSDKATYDVVITVPDGVEAISNGELVGTFPLGDGRTNWSWFSGKPQTTYATFLAIGQFDVRRGYSDTGKQVVTAYSDALGTRGPAARASVERTREVVRFLEGRFGYYPMAELGGVVSPYLSSTLETQTRPAYPAWAFQDGPNDYVVVHETAHQWFGNSVAVRQWKDIWLSEGFATYAQWLWSEAVGEGTAQDLADWTYRYYPADHEVWDVAVADPTPRYLYGAAVHERGALALQALRAAIGDATFFALLRTWASTKEHGNAGTAEFVAMAEEITGRDLDDLFRTWVHSPGKPAPVGARSLTTSEPKSFARIHRDGPARG